MFVSQVVVEESFEEKCLAGFPLGRRISEMKGGFACDYDEDLEDCLGPEGTRFGGCVEGEGAGANDGLPGEGDCVGGNVRRRRRGPADDLGARGEEAAVRYLRRAGYEILERNWVCPAGEADVIARTGDVLVFVEVKTRSGIDKGFPAEAVDAKKRHRYERIALWYLRDYEELDVPVRFDVISLVAVSDDRAMVKHHVNAFGIE